MKFTKIRDVKSPTRANTTDAGIDFFIPEDKSILTNGMINLKPQESCLIPSGIKVEVPEGYALVAFNKSGVAVNKKLHVGACVVDCGYQGEVHINLTNVGLINQTLYPGDKIVQFVLLLLGDPIIEEVEEKDLYQEVSSRGEGGFGSSGI
jgi:dUTP pyrophosphatase